MTCWLERGIHYWEGSERPEAIAIQVPPRPSADHIWDGTQWQDNSKYYWDFDAVNYCWFLRSPEEIAVIDAKLQKVEEDQVLFSPDIIRAFKTRLEVVEAKVAALEIRSNK